jgi:rhamnogalacturonan endolyase
VGDVDADGRDEIIYGSCVIDDDGSGLYSTGLGHGDAMHFTDVDPDRPGLEVFKANGDGRSPAGIQLRDARTGEQIFGIPSIRSGGVGRALALDIDPRHRGLEMWGFETEERRRGRGGSGRRGRREPVNEQRSRQTDEPRQTSTEAEPQIRGIFNARGERISNVTPRTCNMGIWWDGDVLREFLDGVRVSKWDYENERQVGVLDCGDFDCASNNGSKSNPCLCADILGDWREEIIARTRDNKELRIFVTTVPTDRRLVTLMHDPIYRLAVAWQNVSYNQPAHPGFYLGHGMAEPPRPNIVTNLPASTSTSQ